MLGELKGFHFSVIISNLFKNILTCFFPMWLKEIGIITKLATGDCFLNVQCVKYVSVVTFVNRRWWTQSLQNFQQKGVIFFSSFSLLNGRRIMEMRAGIALSAWNVPSLQTNKNITLPLEKSSFLKAAWIWALNQWMRWLC